MFPASSSSNLPGMEWIPGGTFLMGSDQHYPEESPAHDVVVEGFWIDACAVTNEDFARFVAATGYVTYCERQPNAADYPDANPELLVPGSAVFEKPGRPVRSNDWSSWWRYVPGASWKHPDGPGSTLESRARHPVVHVSYEDALAYAMWAGKELPTEAEWERAARGRLIGATFCWGDEEAPGGQLMANYWQGRFPSQNLVLDGFECTAPVGSFPGNDFGLYDMAGNVWEWTQTLYTSRHVVAATSTCCAPENPRELAVRERFDRARPARSRRVLKGGSFLCAQNYCFRYRPAARVPETTDSSTCHIGFRCVLHPG